MLFLRKSALPHFPLYDYSHILVVITNLAGLGLPTTLNTNIYIQLSTALMGEDYNEIN